VRALLLVLLLAPLARAQDDSDEPGLPAMRARAAVDALPVEARVELRRMYMRYRDEVSTRLDQGWTPGMLSDAVIEDVDDPFQPARLLEDDAKARRGALDALEAALPKIPRDSPDYDRQVQRIEDAKPAVARAERKNRREKGICRDWSDDAWFLLTRMDLDQWSVEDRRRDARPFQTAAVVCSPQDEPSVCLAFDPWADGRPSVYSFQAWDAKAPGGRFPADYFLHSLPEKAP
jgi:hypothetical protein